MKGDREMAELVNDATNRPMEALSRIRLPNGKGRMGQSAHNPSNQGKRILSIKPDFSS